MIEIECVSPGQSIGISTPLVANNATDSLLGPRRLIVSPLSRPGDETSEVKESLLDSFLCESEEHHPLYVQDAKRM